MKQIVDWLKRYWDKLSYVRSAGRPNDQPKNSQPGDLIEGEEKAPAQKVYYSTLLRTYSADLDKGRITNAKLDGHI